MFFSDKAQAIILLIGLNFIINSDAQKNVSYYFKNYKMNKNYSYKERFLTFSNMNNG